MSVVSVIVLSVVAVVILAIVFGAGVAYGTWTSDEAHRLKEGDEIERRGWEL